MRKQASQVCKSKRNSHSHGRDGKPEKRGDGRGEAVVKRGHSLYEKEGDQSGEEGGWRSWEAGL